MEKVYLTFENSLPIQLRQDGVLLTAAEMATITGLAIVFNNRLYSSAVYPAAFDWTTRASESVVVLKLGLIPFVSTGIDRNAELIVYTTTYPSGVVWLSLGLNVISLS